MCQITLSKYMSVSYTHLDVYKRQLITLPLMPPSACTIKCANSSYLEMSLISLHTQISKQLHKNNGCNNYLNCKSDIHNCYICNVFFSRHPYPPFNIHYHYRFQAPDHETYEVSYVSFNTEKLENYNWNYLDHYICTRGDTDFALAEV